MEMSFDQQFSMVNGSGSQEPRISENRRSTI